MSASQPHHRSQWQVDHNCCTPSSSRRFWALISSQEQIILIDSDAQAAFPFSISLWWQRNLSEHEAGKQPGKGVKQLKEIMDKWAWIHLAWKKLTKLLFKGKHSYYSLSIFMALYLLKINGKVDPGNMKQVHNKMKKLHLPVKLCKQEEANVYDSWKPRWNTDHQPAKSKKEQSNTHCSKCNHIFPQCLWAKDALFDSWFQYLKTPATKSFMKESIK